MTIIARVDMYPPSMADQPIRVYVADELACVATQIDSLYFLTIQSDRVGKLRFECNGQPLTIVNNEQSDNQSSIVNYVPDSHHGSLKAPIILRKADDRPYKIIENDQVFIIRDGKTYNATGTQVR